MIQHSITQDKGNLLSHVLRVLFLVICGLLVFFWATNSNGQTQKSKTKVVNAHAEGAQQPRLGEYRGVYLGMTTETARATLGEPTLKRDDQDFYVFSDKESAQIAYNELHKVVTISVDYLGGLGAPDYKTVVGADLELRPDGSMYKSVMHERERIWISYNKSAGALPIVTITFQQLK
ncbi:MAG: hypothetical protein ND895_24130 [Pyrinomonadaceae bacterium]|nr:hypothetical protein [Pyrinomonadaceae bacterium]